VSAITVFPRVIQTDDRDKLIDVWGRLPTHAKRVRQLQTVTPSSGTDRPSGRRKIGRSDGWNKAF